MTTVPVLSASSAELSSVEPNAIVLCSRCAAASASIFATRLMTRSDVDRYLALAPDQVEWLIKTGQITVVRMRGEDRFDRRDLDLLIETYKKTAQRRRR